MFQEILNEPSLFLSERTQKFYLVFFFPLELVCNQQNSKTLNPNSKSLFLFFSQSQSLDLAGGEQDEHSNESSKDRGITERLANAREMEKRGQIGNIGVYFVKHLLLKILVGILRRWAHLGQRQTHFEFFPIFCSNRVFLIYSTVLLTRFTRFPFIINLHN